MIAINSIGTYLSSEERLKLCPRLGRLFPYGHALLAKAEDYEEIRAVSEHYGVCITRSNLTTPCVYVAAVPQKAKGLISLDKITTDTTSYRV